MCWLHLDEKVPRQQSNRIQEFEMIWKMLFSINDLVGKPNFEFQHFRSIVNFITEIKVRA